MSNDKTGIAFRQNKLKTILARADYFGALLKARLFNKDTPVICVLIVNNRCNLNCKYCFGNYANSKVPDYTIGELKYLIDELSKLGTKYLNIHGGETLLHDNIGEVVDYIKSKGMYCCLITNGILLPKKIKEIRNVDNITISLDGRRENNDKNRGEGNFDRTLEAIKCVIREKIPLRVSATITKHTKGDVGFLADLAKKLGFTVHFSILFKPLVKAKDCTMSNDEIVEAMKSIIEYKKKGYPIFTSYRSAKYTMDWPLDHNEFHFLKNEDMYKLPRDFKRIDCYYGKTKFIIETDGNVYPCFLLTEPDTFSPLNWKKVGINKAIEHARATRPCITCPTLTHNDHNLLLGLDPKQIVNIISEQIKEGFKRH